MVAGNGGSSSMASHMVGELVCTFENKTRRGLPAICLNVDPAIMTAWSNDVGYEFVFARQIEALGKKGDLVILFSTSGKSQNCIQATQMAEQLDLEVIDFPRSGRKTADIQEFQLKLMHKVVREVEGELFK